MVVAHRKRKQKVRDDRWMVWHIAALPQAKAMPPYEEFMRAGEPQTEEERAGVLLHIGDRLGTRRRHNPRRVRIIRSNVNNG